MTMEVVRFTLFFLVGGNGNGSSFWLATAVPPTVRASGFSKPAPAVWKSEVMPASNPNQNEYFLGVDPKQKKE